MADTAAGTPGKSIAETYFDLLAKEGYRPSFGETGPSGQRTCLRFKSEGYRYVLFVYADDPDFFHLGCSFTLEPDLETSALADLANDVNDRAKVVKVTLSAPEHAVRFQVECFLGGGNPTPALLERSLSSLRGAVGEFFARQRLPKRFDA